MTRDEAFERVGRFTVEYAKLYEKAFHVMALGGDPGQYEQREEQMIWQLVDDLMVDRTCHIVQTWTDSDYADHWRYSCSECGYPIEVGERDVATGNPVSHANFCWNCGRKVVRE